MQEIAKRIKSRALELLADGTVARVIGWEQGEMEADWSPALFTTADEMAVRLRRTFRREPEQILRKVQPRGGQDADCAQALRHAVV